MLEPDKDNAYYDRLIKQRIGKALRNQSRKEKLDINLLEEWVKEDRERRRLINRIKRIYKKIRRDSNE
ncbi:hypothetical protein LI171_15050 [Emergencia timonensis]|uniref:hypothetical protein n=1 Tax=Emergencia timonensis TaxID=1776384 RepID=UPI001D08AD6E|nr:hypothetical protein [Emergencia timonensis]MCB6477565.1 hypothetical protein [Emergencia timonensis]